MFRKLSTSVLLLLLGTPLMALAQGTGTLAGRVTDADTGEGLPGANVIVGGTQLGAATDLDGNYRIIGIPVGQYDVTARFVGYEDETVTNVQISSGYTTEQNFALRSGIELEEVVVEYERPIIDDDAIGAPRIVTGEDIQNLPVRGVTDVAALTSGVVSTEGSGDLFIRGGREQEVQYYVDGVKVASSSQLAVNQAAIQEQEMLIGTIPARYGDVQSGVISITTRSGGNDFFGSAEFVTSEALDSFGYNLAALSLGGPIVPGTVSFFVAGEGEFTSDATPYAIDTYRLTDEAYNNLLANPQVVRVVNPDDPDDVQYVAFPWEEVQNRINNGDVVTADDLAAILGDQIPAGYELESSPVPFGTPETFTEDTPGLVLERGKDDPLENITVNGNLNFNFSSALSLRVGGAYDTQQRDVFNFTNSLYNRDYFYNTERDSYRLYGTFRQRVSNNAFYELRGEFQDFKSYQYPEGFSNDVRETAAYGDISNDFNALSRRYYTFAGVDTDGDGLPDTNAFIRAFTEDGLTRPGTVSGTFSQPGAVLSQFVQRHNQQFRISGSATTQLSVHQLEFGGEYEQQTNRLFAVNNARSLSRFIADNDGAEQTTDETPNGASSYEEIPFDAFRQITTRYGYNYNGTEEVDDQDVDGYFSRSNTNLAPYKPIYYAGYIADKIEFSDLVIQLGLRVDVFDNNATVLRDRFTTVPITRAGQLTGDQLGQLAQGRLPSGISDDYAVYFSDAGDIVGFRDLDGNFFTARGEEAAPAEITNLGNIQDRTRAPFNEPRSAAFTDYDPQVTVMPRLGVSFPVTDRALFFASYNVLSQRPTEQAYAPFSVYEEIGLQNSRTPNPALEPEKTTQYELGFRQRIGERAGLTLSGFYRTQENKVSNRPVTGGAPDYGTYLNADFTTTKGAEVGFELRRTNNLAINANYTLSFAQGTGSDAGATANIVWRGRFFPDFISPADFDQRHTLNATVDYRFGEDEGPMIGGVRLLENFGINVLGQFGSGQRYTALAAPNFSVFDSFTTDIEGGINEVTLPATTRIDLRVDRSFNLGFAGSSLKAYLWVQNLFDTENVVAVYRATGVPDTDGYLTSTGGQAFISGRPDPEGAAFNYNTYVRGPLNNGGNQSSAGANFYSLPRRIRLGLLFDF